MKDQFEKFVRDHKNEFDDLQPGEHIWDNIETQESTSNTNWSKILWRAASVLLIFIASFFANEAWHQYRDGNGSGVAESEAVHELQIPELLEAEAYYTSKFEDKLKEVKTYSTQYPEIEQDLKVEMAELDKAFEELKTDLKDDIDNEEIVEAMIQNYRIKVRMLEEILSQMKSQESNSEKDEIIEYEM